MTNRLLKWFQSTHLNGRLREVALPIADLAAQLDNMLPESTEKTAGMRKLLEAKDCFVRARIESETAQEG